MKRRELLYKIMIGTLLLVLLLIVMIPLYWALIMSLDGATLDVIPRPPRFWPEKFSLFNYEYAAEAIPLFRYYFNTIIITVINTVISVFTALMCAYAFSKGEFHFKKFWFLFMLAVMMIPFEARMVPLFLQYGDWGMTDTWWPLVLGSLGWVYGMFLAKQNLDSIPNSFRESASIDGAGEWRVFLTIILPLCGPIIATLAIFQVVQQWNSFLWPLIVINKPELQVISVGIATFNQGETVMYLGPRLAVAMLGALPMVIMFVFLQKYIVQSVAMSGIKQ